MNAYARLPDRQRRFLKCVVRTTYGFLSPDDLRHMESDPHLKHLPVLLRFHQDRVVVDAAAALWEISRLQAQGYAFRDASLALSIHQSAERELATDLRENRAVIV